MKSAKKRAQYVYMYTYTRDNKRTKTLLSWLLHLQVPPENLVGPQASGNKSAGEPDLLKEFVLLPKTYPVNPSIS